ncbi:LysR family transcriptional regulator [Streptomyces morookaense]|uniref:LysR family transcriptional regulator n=1 Tax=Streptomyces TaxID=1883 RepID=UPI001D101EE0|nr:LysR family transcriptional regulator [Streptomyces sp. ET3-23]MCC2279836.1 LysR family transcriptional regulator [Streptomyces sp. ET3-23]
MDVELRHLRAFLAVARHLSFSRAASELRMTQPSLSRSVQRLEAALGTRLVHRTSRNVTLTPAGQYAQERLGRQLPALDSTLNGIRDSGTIRLGFAWLLPDPWTQRAVVRFENATRGTVEPVRHDDPAAAVDLGEVDVAVIRGAPPGGNATAVPFLRERRVAAVSTSSPLAARDRLGWDEFRNWPLVVNTVSGSTTPADWADGQAPDDVVPCGNFDEWLELVAAGRGVGVVPDSAVRRSPHSWIRFLPIDDAPPIPVHIVYSPGSRHPLLRAFVEAAMAERPCRAPGTG